MTNRRNLSFKVCCESSTYTLDQLSSLLYLRMYVQDKMVICTAIVSQFKEIINTYILCLFTGEVYMLTSDGGNPYKKQGQVYRVVEPLQ